MAYAQYQVCSSFQQLANNAKLFLVLVIYITADELMIVKFTFIELRKLFLFDKQLIAFQRFGIIV